MQTWNAQLNKKEFRDGDGLGFCLHLCQATTKMVGHPSRTLLMYSDMVCSIIVGDTEHLLVRKVSYKRDGSGSAFFESLHVQ